MPDIRVALLTISDTRILSEDNHDLLEAFITADGHRPADRQLVQDDIYAIRAQVSQWIVDPRASHHHHRRHRLYGSDSTPKRSRPSSTNTSRFGGCFIVIVFNIGTSTIQSRALAGLVNGTLIFSLRIFRRCDPELGSHPSISWISTFGRVTSPNSSPFLRALNDEPVNNLMPDAMKILRQYTLTKAATFHAGVYS